MLTDSNQPKPIAGAWYDVADLMSASIAPPDWILTGLLARGDVALLAAPPGSGKTYLALEIAIGLAIGDQALGFEVVDRGRTAVLESDMSLEIAMNYIQRLTHGREPEPHSLQGRIGLRIANSCHLDVESDQRTLTHELLDFRRGGSAYGVGEGLDLIIVDTLRGYLAGDEQDSGAISAFFKSLRDMLPALGNPAVILLHHMRKSGQNDRTETSERVRGSSAIMADVDSAFAVVSVLGGLHQIRTLKSRRRAPAPFSVRFDGYSAANETEEEAPLRLVRENVVTEVVSQSNEAQLAITEFLRTCPDKRALRQTVVAALERDRMKERTINKAYRALKTRKIAHSESRGRHVFWYLEGPDSEQFSKNGTGESE